MGGAALNRVKVAKGVLLDGRLALFHEEQRWLAVADLHFGYELSQRAAGNLFPLWGMQTIETRLQELLADYRPRHLVLLGDLVHNQTGAGALTALLERLRATCDVIVLGGNHDRKLRRSDLAESWRTDGFYFHHGHCAVKNGGDIQVVGHHHPAGVVRDGAGLRLKLPAFVQQANCWIMPAFSPWAAGAEWPRDEKDRIWLCSPQRILRMNDD
jgi:DNA ligase-associated metallophosphoesterase